MNTSLKPHPCVLAIAAIAATLVLPISTLAADAYVQTTGANYIVSDYYPNPNTRIEVDFQLDDTANVSQPRIFATRTTSATALSCALYVNSGKNFAFCMKDGDIASAKVMTAGDTARHVFVLDGPAGTAKLVTGTTTNDYSFTFTRTTTADQPLHLFVQTSWIAGTTAKAKLYSCKISEKQTDGTYKPVRDYAPAVQDGIAGVKCALTGAFHASAASAQLAAGGDVVSIESGDAYLKSDGASYIDTGYFPTKNTKIAIDFAYLGKGDGVTQPRFFGSVGGVVETLYLNGSQQFAFNCYDNTNTPARVNGVNVVGVNTGTGIAYDTGVRHTFVLDAPNATATMTTGNLTSYNNKSLAAPLPDTAASKSLYVFSGADWSGQYSIVKLYSLDIYESGKLVRSYVPYVKDGVLGLYDTTGGSFLAYQSGSYGGDIGFNNSDAYLQSDGTQAIDTGYYPTQKTSFEVDYSIVEKGNATQPRIFGSTGLRYIHYINGSGNFAFAAYDGAITPASGTVGYNQNMGIKMDTGIRHKFHLDWPNKTAWFATGSTTNYSTTAIATELKAEKASRSVFVFNSSDWSTERSVIKLYSLKVYEDGALVRQYLPFKSGDATGLYETETGEFLVNYVEDGNAFGIGGAGADGAGAKLLVKPQDCRVKGTRPAVLTAFAPGAVAYRWTQDGEEIAGEIGATLSVSRIEGATLVEYTVTPLFDVFGKTVEGDTASCTVDHGFMPIMIVVR